MNLAYFEDEFYYDDVDLGAPYQEMRRREWLTDTVQSLVPEDTFRGLSSSRASENSAAVSYTGYISGIVEQLQKIIPGTAEHEVRENCINVWFFLSLICSDDPAPRFSRRPSSGILTPFCVLSQMLSRGTATLQFLWQ